MNINAWKPQGTLANTCTYSVQQHLPAWGGICHHQPPPNKPTPLPTATMLYRSLPGSAVQSKNHQWDGDHTLLTTTNHQPPNHATRVWQPSGAKTCSNKQATKRRLRLTIKHSLQSLHVVPIPATSAQQYVSTPGACWEHDTSSGAL